jgi:hypothetical protein
MWRKRGVRCLISALPDQDEEAMRDAVMAERGAGEEEGTPQESEAGPQAVAAAERALAAFDRRGAGARAPT